MDTSTMKYPFGRCANCGKEFNSELLSEYDITHCPWCGELILDCFHDSNPPPGSLVKPDLNRYIYCEECGTRIYERSGKNNEGGNWIDEKRPGVCSGPCERELCGNCADWDVNGECEACRNSPCGQCPSHDAVEMCKSCEHLPERKKWSDYEEPEETKK
jgi:DNA-directed RNA polymerase subunit RPC12/RpoP